MIEVLGWIGTAAVVLGYWLNANGKLLPALITWILGDIIWIVYDIQREIFPHLGLCIFIIMINSFGIIKLKKEKYEQRSNERGCQPS